MGGSEDVKNTGRWSRKKKKKQQQQQLQEEEEEEKQKQKDGPSKESMNNTMNLQQHQQQQQLQHQQQLRSPIWQHTILMGERCKRPTFSGLILYDDKGNPLPLRALTPPRATGATAVK
jgi:predicted acyl esterase